MCRIKVNEERCVKVNYNRKGLTDFHLTKDIIRQIVDGEVNHKSNEKRVACCCNHCNEMSVKLMVTRKERVVIR